MAGIQSLAVRGIRSFGPEETDEQRISFERPLTLILGQNGCGKTTIIECLRYAITGQMPPGSRNECFVHDAKINRSTEVLGQVKLKIFNAKDRKLEVTRSMKVTALQKKKTKFQTLDSFLSIIDESGKTTDVSSRCADLDSVMHEELGVSKAILNSVIFCHQEDSSWPLDEGKKVKERFDEIFDADKYSDCFDTLRKIRKEYTVQLKLLEQEVGHLTDEKQELDKRKLDVVNTETRISEAEIRVSELTKELTPITEKINSIETLQKNLVEFESEREKAKNKLEQCRSQEEDLKKRITSVFEGSQEELEKSISNYKATVESKKEELNASYKKNMNFNKEEEKIANEKMSNEVKYNKLAMLESQNQEKMDKRNLMIVDVAKLAEMEMDKVENEDAAEAMSKITDKIKSLNAELKELKAQADAEEKKLQSIVDQSIVALSGHNQKISSKESDIQAVEKKIVKIGKEITDANKSKQKLELLEQKLKTAEEDYERTEKEFNIEESQKEIAEEEKVMETHEQEQEQNDEKISLLQKQSAKLIEKKKVEESLKEKEKQLSVLKNKHRTTITELLGEMPESSFAMSINKVEVAMQSEVNSLKKKLKENHTKVTSLETERKHVRELVRERRAELAAAEDRMYQACGTQPYEATLAKVTASVDRLQEETNELQSSIFIISKFKGQLKDNNCCPLCNRGFDNETEVTDLISQLATQVMNVPSKLERATEELQRESAKKDDLLAMRSLNDKINSLKDTDIPKLEERLSDLDKQIATITESTEELSLSLAEPEQKLASARQIKGDMPLLDRYTNEIKTTTKEFDTINSQCTDLISDITLEDAIAKQKELKQKISTLRARIKSANAKINSHNKRLQTMADKKNKMKEEMLNVQKKIQELYNLQETQKQLEADKEKFIEELKELKDGTEPLEAVLKEKQESKNEVVKKNRGEVDVKNNYIMKVVHAFDKVETVQKEIKQHLDKNIPNEIEKIKKANDKLMDKQKQIMIDRDTLTKRIDTLKDEVARQEVYKRNLDDNLKLLTAQAGIVKHEEELKNINEKLSGVSVEMIAEKQPLLEQQTRLFREKAQNEGSLRELKEQLKRSKADLNRSLKKNVETKYRQAFYKLHVTKAIDKDIRDYSVALEKCLMEFHREKMENINLIIRQMWRKIYRGNDIDYIEIKTEGGMTADSERRKYDYRVVQSKNGVEIDMRGRCSAGQKVLACLIIRLALAETFSSRFGILALDEPTTNLDEENVKSLCSALGEIVQERMAQKNFMFIIITHDREFIESLGNIDKVSHFYEVSRNDDGKSRVKKIRFS
ncbi:DNA repair protein RAD50-like [Epargyreus clarus]|uniref:DNA repair protein RAD50-like n=1 Tax=Epargyreus clarus TaxID=520877 RepID=UPI003C2FC542